MSDTRRRNIDWNTGDATTPATWDGAKLAVLMDIRDELQRLNALLNCQNFISIPRQLESIRKNTVKPKVKK